jgi:uncharacterized protein YehS (DUF1456 family)
VRYALRLNDQTLIGIFRLTGAEVSPEQLETCLKKEDEPGFSEMSARLLEQFLDGLIIHRRGKKEGTAGQPAPSVLPLTNNTVLKKLRIAMEFKEDDMIAVMKLSGVDLSASELTALFRKPGHKNYRPCGDQFLRNFLQGLTVKYRGSEIQKLE